MNIDVDTQKMNNASSSLQSCEEVMKKAADQMEEVNSKLGHFSGDAIQELRTRLKMQEESVRNERRKLIQLKLTLDKIIQLYEETEVRNEALDSPVKINKSGLNRF